MAAEANTSSPPCQPENKAALTTTTTRDKKELWTTLEPSPHFPLEDKTSPKHLLPVQAHVFFFFASTNAFEERQKEDSHTPFFKLLPDRKSVV